MKLLKFLSICFVISLFSASVSASVTNPLQNIFSSDLPEKTIVIKHPAAFNVDDFFATNKFLMFEIYKVGSTENLNKVIASFKKNPNVEACEIGPLTGDYQAISISMKSTKDKQWFAELFKKAGLNSIKINNNPVVKVDKM